MEGKSSIFAHILVSVLAAGCASLVVLYNLEAKALSTTSEKLTKTETAYRETLQKVYDLQEGRDDERFRMEGDYQVQLFNKDQELESCKQVIKALQPPPPAATKKVGAFHE